MGLHGHQFGVLLFTFNYRGSIRDRYNIYRTGYVFYYNKINIAYYYRLMLYYLLSIVKDKNKPLKIYLR